MSFVAKSYIHNLRNLFCLIRGTVNIEDRDVAWEGPSVHSSRTDKISVDEASSGSTVQESFDKVEFARVYSSNFHWQK